MGLFRSYRIKVVGFAFNSEEMQRLFRVDQIYYRPLEQSQRWQVGNYRNITFTEALHLEFALNIGLLDQNLNGDESYGLSNKTFTAPGEVTTPVMLLNRLKNGQLLKFFPIVDNGRGQVDLSTSYEVVNVPQNRDVIASSKAGFTNSSYMIRFVTKDPLTSYPTWINP